MGNLPQLVLKRDVGHLESLYNHTGVRKRSRKCSSRVFHDVTHFTLSLNSLPALNAGTFFASETMLSPVCGLRTVLASLCFLSNVPKPGRETLSPSATASSIASKTALTAVVALVFGISALTATMLMSSDLVIVGRSFLAL